MRPSLAQFETACRGARRTPLVALCMLAAASLAVQGCGDDATTTRDPTADLEKGTELGEPLSLQGQDVRLRVTATEVIDPVPVGDLEPQGGGRFVGVRLRLENMDDMPYSSTPVTSGTLKLADGSQAVSTVPTGGPCASRFQSEVRVPVGAQVEGCLVFWVPAGGKPASFRFGLDQGLGPQTGVWRLPK